jgi:hypothetical protein
MINNEQAKDFQGCQIKAVSMQVTKYYIIDMVIMTWKVLLINSFAPARGSNRATADLP